MTLLHLSPLDWLNLAAWWVLLLLIDALLLMISDTLEEHEQHLCAATVQLVRWCISLILALSRFLAEFGRIVFSVTLVCSVCAYLSGHTWGSITANAVWLVIFWGINEIFRVCRSFGEKHPMFDYMSGWPNDDEDLESNENAEKH